MTPRDEALLRGLIRVRVARTEHLVELFFPSLRGDTAAARLRRLYDAGLVEVRAGDRAQPNLYSLGPAGKAWARRHGLAIPRVPRGDLEHHLGVVSVWCGIAAFCHRSGQVRLRHVRPEWDLRREYGSAHAGVVPDALVELAVGQRLVRFALEIDRGTERHAEWRRKLARYEAVLDAPGAGELGLVVVADGGERRQGALRQLIAASWPNWFVVEPATGDGEGLVRGILMAAGTPLTESPCGEGTIPPPTHESATDSARPKAEPSR